MDVRWLLLILLDTFMLFSGLVTAEPKDNQVYITSRLCGVTVNVGSSHDQDGWKRFLFSHTEMCKRTFSCQVRFTANQAEICLDFSRLQLTGRETEMVLYQQNMLVLDRLTSEWYPRKERYMHSKTCVSPGTTLLLEMRADCSKPLNMAFMGWFYVYSQSSTTGVMYFVDGVCKHRHRLSEGVPVTVRSQFWADTAGEESVQDCSLRLSMPYSYERRRICITWQPLADPVVPAGIKITIRKVYVNMDRTLNHYVTLVTGNKVHTGQQCFVVSEIHEIAIEVLRNTISAGLHAVQDGKTVFSLRAELEEEKELTTVRQEKPIVDVDASATVGPIGTKEDQETVVIEDSSARSTMAIVLKAVLGSAAVLSVFCCLGFYANRKIKTTRAQAAQSQTDTGQLQGSMNNISGSLASPEAHGMLPITPSAPSSVQEQDNERTVILDTGTSAPPPSYDEVRNKGGADSSPSAPPAYSDLFPARS